MKAPPFSSWFTYGISCSALLLPIADAEIRQIECGLQVQRCEEVPLKQVKKPSVKEVRFERAEFPIVLEPDPNDLGGCFIALPIERLKEKGCSVKFVLLVEEWSEQELKELEANVDFPQRDRHISLLMQMAKSQGQSGFCASARRLPVGKPCETTLHYTSKSPPKFYTSLYVAPWVKRVTIQQIEISEGHRFIEQPLPASPEQEASIVSLVQHLADDDYATRHQSHRTLVEFGSPAIPVLSAFRSDEDPERRVRIREIIKEIEQMQQLRMPAE